MSDSVSAYEAKTHLSALLARASAGESITITKHGRPLARLVPVDDRPRLAEVAREMAAFRESLGSETVDIRELIDEGRTY